jgi:hypothetical protein
MTACGSAGNGFSHSQHPRLGDNQITTGRVECCNWMFVFNELPPLIGLRLRIVRVRQGGTTTDGKFGRASVCAHAPISELYVARHCMSEPHRSSPTIGVLRVVLRRSLLAFRFEPSFDFSGGNAPFSLDLFRAQPARVYQVVDVLQSESERSRGFRHAVGLEVLLCHSFPLSDAIIALVLVVGE